MGLLGPTLRDPASGRRCGAGDTILAPSITAAAIPTDCTALPTWVPPGLSCRGGVRSDGAGPNEPWTAG
jgi:hypothetical protein